MLPEPHIYSRETERRKAGLIPAVLGWVDPGAVKVKQACTACGTPLGLPWEGMVSSEHEGVVVCVL